MSSRSKSRSESSDSSETVPFGGAFGLVSAGVFDSSGEAADGTKGGGIENAGAGLGCVGVGIKGGGIEDVGMDAGGIVAGVGTGAGDAGTGAAAGMNGLAGGISASSISTQRKHAFVKTGTATERIL